MSRSLLKGMNSDPSEEDTGQTWSMGSSAKVFHLGCYYIDYFLKISFYFVYIRCEVRAHEYTCLGSQKGVLDPLALKLQVVRATGHESWESSSLQEHCALLTTGPSLWPQYCFLFSLISPPLLTPPRLFPTLNYFICYFYLFLF